MLKYITLVSLLTTLVAGTGCQQADVWGDPLPAERIQAALNGWVAAGNRVTAQCEEEVHNITLLVTDSAELNELCTSGEDVIGCRKGGPDWDGTRHISILIDEALLGTADFDDTIEHELRHWMAQCSLGNSDRDHANAHVWYPHLGRDVR